jgi:hypothetical protein
LQISIGFPPLFSLHRRFQYRSSTFALGQLLSCKPFLIFKL